MNNHRHSNHQDQINNDKIHLIAPRTIIMTLNIIKQQHKIVEIMIKCVTSVTNLVIYNGIVRMLTFHNKINSNIFNSGVTRWWCLR